MSISTAAAAKKNRGHCVGFKRGSMSDGLLVRSPQTRTDGRRIYKLGKRICLLLVSSKKPLSLSILTRQSVE